MRLRRRHERHRRQYAGDDDTEARTIHFLRAGEISNSVCSSKCKAEKSQFKSQQARLYPSGSLSAQRHRCRMRADLRC